MTCYARSHSKEESPVEQVWEVLRQLWFGSVIWLRLEVFLVVFLSHRPRSSSY
ncbi:hypothetical protein HanIR_Chr11g0527921 [Helianthus annuus]|nr:hypothetical protein HanIR_Chr11g0527921 [Helianthus annuus]